MNHSSPARIALLTATLASLYAADPWTGAMVGTSNVPGSHTVSGGTFTVNGASGYVWGTADNFYFIQQAATGDLTITARVQSMTNVSTWSKAGVMVRESLAIGSANVMAFQTPGRGRYLHRRTTTGAASSQSALINTPAPSWLRLQRTGNSFRAYNSTDGVAWTASGPTVTVNMTAAVRVGLVASSDNWTLGSQAVFTNVGLQTTTAPVNQAPTVTLAATSSVTSATTTLAATVTDDAGTPTLAWSLVTAGSTAAVRFANAAVEDASVSFPRNGTYNLKLTATDAQGLSSSKTIAVTVNAAGAFAIQGTVQDNGAAPAPGVATTLTWTPANAVVGTVTTSSTGAFAHNGLIGTPTDYAVQVAGSP